MNKLKVINLTGGPGSGKSTTAAGLFYKMKIKGYSVELVTEYSKDKTYEGHFNHLEDQLYIFGKQHRRLARLVGHVDYAITDSPLYLSIIYNKSYGSTFDKFVLECYNSYDNINIFIERAKPYVNIGRSQTENEARDIDKNIKALLTSTLLPYDVVKGDVTAPDVIYYNYIKNK